MPGLVEPFVINQEDASDITQTDTTAAVMGDWFVYRVPIGMTIILRPEDVLAVDLDDTNADVGVASSQIKLEVRDATGTEKKPVLGPLLYGSFSASGVGEFRDEDKLVHLGIGREIEVAEREYIALMCNSASSFGADKDTSWFELRTHRRRG